MTAVSSANDRQLLAESVRRCVQDRRGPRRHLGDPPSVDLELWQALADEIGLAALVVPLSNGGAGARVADLVAVLEELAAQLAPVPALASAGMATPVLRAAPPTSATGDLLQRLAGGSLVVTVAWPDPASTTLTPGLTYSQGRVRGQAAFVLDGSLADVVLALAASGSDAALVAVDATSAGVTRRPMSTLDLTRGMAQLDLDTPAPVLAHGPVEHFTAGLDIALVGIAAEQVGIAGRCLDEAVAYAKQRVQFGRPIGSFQAIKHLLVSLLMDVELARSALDTASVAADEHLAAPTPETARALRVAASMAKAMCSEAAVRVASESLHVFGGIGFTWEHDAHLYFRRAKTLELLLGSPAEHRTRLAAGLGVGG